MQTPADLASLGLPPADQVGFVVRDLEASMKLYGPMFGPWILQDGSVNDSDYRGRKSDVKLSIAYGQSGPLQIELIEWGGGDSPHAEFIRAGREGMHHLRFRVDDADGWIEKMKSVGYESVWYKKWCADTTFVYMQREGDPLWIEFLEMPPGGPGTA